jgi:hypothetical protein
VLIVNCGTRKCGSCCQKSLNKSDGAQDSSKQFGVPKGTLDIYVKNNTKYMEELVEINLGKRPI